LLEVAVIFYHIIRGAKLERLAGDPSSPCPVMRMMGRSSPRTAQFLKISVTKTQANDDPVIDINAHLGNRPLKTLENLLGCLIASM
jgi:hypothetical protein